MRTKLCLIMSCVITVLCGCADIPPKVTIVDENTIGASQDIILRDEPTTEVSTEIESETKEETKKKPGVSNIVISGADLYIEETLETEESSIDTELQVEPEPETVYITEEPLVEESKVVKTGPCTGGEEHVTEVTTIQAATCLIEGIEATKCTRCGAILGYRNIPAIGHNWSDWKTTEATCTAAGTSTRTCQNCQQTEKKSTKATGHTFSEYVVTKAATCNEEGEKTRTCSKCGLKETVKLAAISHEYNDSWTVTKRGTCQEEGEEVRFCKNCNNKEVRKTSKGDHYFSGWDSIKYPTCTEEGVQSRTCRTCGYIESKVLPKVEHKRGIWETVTDSTCTQVGKKQITCVDCGTVLEEGEIPLKAHNWEGTLLGDGTEQFKCTVCGQVRKD